MMVGHDNDIDFGVYMGAAARALLGKPNQNLSSANELRFGTNGSVTVMIRGPKQGTWYDHEAKEGGGVLDLLKRERGLVNGAAMEWLRTQCGAYLPEGGNRHAPIAARVPPRDAAPPQKRVPLGEAVATWDYTDAAGKVLFQVRRYEPAGQGKTYRQFRPDPRGGWKAGLEGVALVPYRHPEIAVLAPGTLVFLGEGEKCVDRLRAEGLLATCNPMGAGKWWPELTPHLAGLDIVQLPDNDEAGRKDVSVKYEALREAAGRFRVLNLPGLPEKGDVVDWLDAGGDGEQLLALVDQLEDYIPPVPPPPPLSVWTRIRQISHHSPALQRLVSGDFSTLTVTREDARDHALGKELKRAGFSYDEMRQALVEWEHGFGAEHHADGDERWFDRIWDKAGRIAPEHMPLPSEEPLPLRRDKRPPLAFPVDYLPTYLRNAADAIQAKTQAPMSICAQSVIAAASLAAQQHADVELPTGSRKPLSLFCITVAESGERKSAVDLLATDPITRWQVELRERQDQELLAYWIEMDAWKAARESVFRDKSLKGDREAIVDRLKDIGPEPVRPLASMIIADNLTVEGIEKYFLDSGQPSIGLFTAEGGKIIGGHMMSEENRMKAGATLNILWDGTALNRVRSGDGTHSMPGRRVAVHIMVQPNVVDSLFGDPTLNSLGTLARMLVVSPETTAGTRFWKESTVAHDSALLTYRNELLDLFRRAPAVGAKKCELAPRALKLSPAAREVWIEFHDEVEAKLRPEAAYASIRPFGSKLAEHAARLAGVMAMFQNPDAQQVEEAEINVGIALARHYAEEALRLVENGLTDPDLVQAEKLLAWLQEHKVERFHLPRIYRDGPGGIRDRSAAERVVGVLERHGWVRRLPMGTEVDGRPRRDAWDLVTPSASTHAESR